MFRQKKATAFEFNINNDDTQSNTLKSQRSSLKSPMSRRLSERSEKSCETEEEFSSHDLLLNS